MKLTTQSRTVTTRASVAEQVHDRDAAAALFVGDELRGGVDAQRRVELLQPVRQRVAIAAAARPGTAATRGGPRS